MNFYGQVIYAPVFLQPCQDSLTSVTPFWKITRLSDGRVIKSNFTDTVATLETNVEYTIVHLLDDELSENELVFTSVGMVRDTIIISPFSEYITISNPPPLASLFMYCDRLAEGKITTTHLNGKTWVEGTFRNGVPIDTVRIYFNHGGLKQIIIPNKDGTEKGWSYYSNGNKEHWYNTKSGKAKFYDRNGKRIRLEKGNDR